MVGAMATSSWPCPGKPGGRGKTRGDAHAHEDVVMAPGGGSQHLIKSRPPRDRGGSRTRHPRACRQPDPFLDLSGWGPGNLLRSSAWRGNITPLPISPQSVPTDRACRRIDVSPLRIETGSRANMILEDLPMTLDRRSFVRRTALAGLTAVGALGKMGGTGAKASPVERPVRV